MPATSSAARPRCSVRVIERWPGSLPFERCHLLPQSQVFDHEVGSPPTHHPDRTGAERDEEYENMEHSGGVWLFPPRNLKPEIPSSGRGCPRCVSL